MANARTAARSMGDDYQYFYFWLHCIKAILPNSKILSVTFEEGDVLPFDDVAVYYTQPIKNELTDTTLDIFVPNKLCLRL